MLASPRRDRHSTVSPARCTSASTHYGPPVVDSLRAWRRLVASRTRLAEAAGPRRSSCIDTTTKAILISIAINQPAALFAPGRGPWPSRFDAARRESRAFAGRKAAGATASSGGAGMDARAAFVRTRSQLTPPESAKDRRPCLAGRYARVARLKGDRALRRSIIAVAGPLPKAPKPLRARLFAPLGGRHRGPAAPSLDLA